MHPLTQDTTHSGVFEIAFYDITYSAEVPTSARAAGMRGVQPPLESEADAPRREHGQPVRQTDPTAETATGAGCKGESQSNEEDDAENEQPHAADQQGGLLPPAARQGLGPATQKIDVVRHPAGGNAIHPHLRWIVLGASEGRCREHDDDEQAGDGCCTRERSFFLFAEQGFIRRRPTGPCPVFHEQRPAWWERVTALPPSHAMAGAMFSQLTPTGRCASSSPAPFQNTWMPMQKSRNADSRTTMVVPVGPTRSASRAEWR